MMTEIEISTFIMNGKKFFLYQLKIRNRKFILIYSLLHAYIAVYEMNGIKWKNYEIIEYNIFSNTNFSNRNRRNISTSDSNKKALIVDI
jgi:hypothetical protein